MSEYGKERTLTEILEELSYLCTTSRFDCEQEITVIFPKTILERLSYHLRSKERIVLFGTPNADGGLVSKLHTFNGIVNLYAEENVTVTAKVANE